MLLFLNEKSLHGRFCLSVFGPLNNILKTYLPNDQIKSIYKAYLFACKAHQKQDRSSGEPYITHPVAVATILANIHLDAPTIIAALLHDVVEDTEFSREYIEEKFGLEVANLVEGVTKLTQIKFESRAEAQAENFRKMVMAMAHDIRVILIKLADRLHNIRTLHHLSTERRERIANETLDIYAPIASRLGMNNFRIELEENSFQILYPLRYQVMLDALKKARGNHEEIIVEIEKKLDAALNKLDLPHYRLWGREKHLYSVYQKMRRKHLQFSDIMDVYAFRVVVSTVDECYRVLGILHNVYKPIPQRFKDYIAIPKANGYQSLHTVLFGPYGIPIEIQIRTEEMDRMAEYGIAAHWLYKTDESTIDQTKLTANSWIRDLLEIQQNVGSSLEFIENVKFDLFPEEVYVFTPKGEIMSLPRGATGVDFAYAVHSDIGNHCVAVKIDRRLSPLSRQLRNGQTVEVITAANMRPKPSWLNFVATGKARSRIRHYLKHQKQSESLVLGKCLLERALTTRGVTLETLAPERLNQLLTFLHYEAKEELFEAIGLGNQPAQLIASRLVNDEILPEEVPETPTLPEPLYIKGTEGLAVSFAKCCYPIPGDPIMGILTAGRGLVIHHEECKKLLEYRHHPGDLIPVRWEESEDGDFEARLRVEIVNARGVYANIATAIAKEDANIDHITLKKREGPCDLIDLVISVRNRKHLTRIIQAIRQQPNVTRVLRYAHVQ